jgi:hypothetical protein
MRLTFLGFACLGLMGSNALAKTINSTPSTYQAAIGTLQAGDTLALAAGHYPRLQLSGLTGAPGAFITITGPTNGSPAIIDADSVPCCNTVQLDGSAYVAIKNLTVDGMNVDGADGINAKGNPVHDILIEGNNLINHLGSQQTVAISTKTSAWNWVIRKNRIVGAGTGLYLGNSTGDSPFVAGVIEYNVVDDTIGYDMEIKWQLPRPAVAGMPTTPSSTLIRHNVFKKSDRPSQDGDRPNVLVGGFPSTGDGSNDRYEIYGNFFFHNPYEALFQASGRVTLHDNLFLDGAHQAIALQDQDLPLRQAFVYDNTVFGTVTGLSISGTQDQGTRVVGNAIFAATPITGTATELHDNVTGSEADAATQLVMPSHTLPCDLYPRAGALTGATLDLSAFAMDLDYDRDFNGTSKGTFTYRGAYAGGGTNPGWVLSVDIQGEAPSSSPPDGGATSSDAGRPGDPNDAGVTPSGGDSGGCSLSGASGVPLLTSWLLVGVAWLLRRRAWEHHQAQRASCCNNQRLRSSPPA